MLQSFVGTYDRNGLRTLRYESESSGLAPCQREQTVAFWAILDSAALPEIQQAIVSGNRISALKEVVNQARSLGRFAD